MKKARIMSALVLALVLVFAMTALADAAQLRTAPGYYGAQKIYQETPKEFTADGVSNYPSEIYLPNEEDPAKYRIHSNYTKNTDACAACHATHTAAGQSLLQWGSVYDACMACHDGTITTTYDVQSGTIGTSGQVAKGGKFGTPGAMSLSNHNVTGAVNIYAAPGGSLPTDNGYTNNGGKSWDIKFGCESCHSPHGQGGNARILHADPNGMAYKNKKTDVTLTVTTVANEAYAAKAESADTWIKGYPYNKDTAIYANGILLATSAYTIDNSTGTTVIKFNEVPAEPVTAKYVPALKVAMEIANYLPQSGGAEETVQHVSGMNSFCGACHTDYNTETDAKSHDNLTGTYTKAYRHTVGVDIKNFGFEANIANLPMPTEKGDKLTCLTCHYAHGTDKTLWDNTLAAGYQGAEISGTSALKRLPNMGTCDACHQKGDSNDGYDANTKAGTGSTVDVAEASKTYVGSASCKSCHNDKYNAWKATQHTKMVGLGPSSVAPQVAENWATTQMGQAGLQLTDVLFTIGSKWKQRYIFSADTYNAQTGALPAKGTYTNGLVIAGGTASQYSFVLSDGSSNFANATMQNYGGKEWTKECIACHVTGFNPETAYTNQAVSFTKDSNGKEIAVNTNYFVEPGVGCEMCHGEGSLHMNTQNPKDIKNPKNLDSYRSTDVCGQCHNRGWDTTPQTYNAGGREDILTFRPGMDLMKDTKWRPNANTSNGTMKYFTFDGSNWNAYLPNTSQTSNYAPDNVELGHHEQYEGFIQSKHYLKGNMSCATCHEVHRAQNSTLLASGGYKWTATKNVTADGSTGTTYTPAEMNHGLLKGKGATSAERVTNTCGSCHGFTTWNLDGKYMPKTVSNSIRGDVRTHNIFTPAYKSNGKVWNDTTGLYAPGSYDIIKGRYNELPGVNFDTAIPIAR